MLVSCDWAHNEEKQVFYNGQTFIDKKELKEGDTVVCENIPLKLSKGFLKNNIEVLRVHQNLVADYREEKGLEKTDEGDAILIYMYYKEYPKDFKVYNGQSTLQNLYVGFKTLQKTKVTYHNRFFSDDAKMNKDIEKAFKSLSRNFIKEATKELQKYPIYTEFLVNIKGIGKNTAPGLISYIGDINKFPTVSKLWAYAGLHLKDGKAPKLRKGQNANWNGKFRSLLLGIVADSFIKQRTPKYRNIYDKEKEKLSKKEYPVGYLHKDFNFKKKKGGYCYKETDTKLTKLHIDKRARRKMMQIFVRDLYNKWKEIEKRKK